MSVRSLLGSVRNPVLGLPSARLFAALPLDSRMALAAFLSELRRDAAVRAQQSWKSHKAPMALYWKVVAVWAGHLARVCRKVNAEQLRLAA